MRISFPDVIFNDGEMVIPLEYASVLSGLGRAQYEITTAQMANGIQTKKEAIPTPRIIEIVTRVSRYEGDAMQNYFDGRQDLKILFGQRYIFGSCELSDLEYKHGARQAPTLTVQFVCPDPRFYSVDVFGKNLAGIVPLFGWPWESTVDEGVNFGYLEFSDETFYTNEGHEPVGFRMRFIATRGTASGMTVLHPRTGQFLTVDVTLLQGDELLISTTDEDMDAYLNGVSVFDSITPQSEFWQLQPGDNLIRITAENKTNLDVWLNFQSRYSSALIFPEVT